MLIVPIPNPSHPRCNLFNDPHLSGPVQQRQRQVPTSSHAEHCSQQEGKGRRARTRGGGWSKISPKIFSTLTLYLFQTCDPENYANPVSVSTTPYTGDGAGVGLAESGDAHPTPATPLSSGASSVCVKPNEPNPDLTDCSQVRQRLRKICFTESCSVEDLPIFAKCTSFGHKGWLSTDKDGYAFRAARGACWDAMNRDCVSPLQNLEGHTIWIFVSISCSRD